MLTIQDLGTSILNGNPNKFYIFGGIEYGIKERYLSILKSHYGDYSEFSSVSDIITLMSNKQLIPLKPKLYIVRYDEDFIKELSDNTSKVIDNLCIIGTVVCIYEIQKHTSKCNKYLPRYTADINSVDKQFIKKYLITDYPDFGERVVDIIVSLCDNYKEAEHICCSLSHLSPDRLRGITQNDISRDFGITQSVSDSQFKVGFASRNFEYIISLLDKYDEFTDSLLYNILSTLLELEKLICNPRLNSDFRPYLKRWTISDVYMMFKYVYSEIYKIRSISGYDIYNSLIYICSLLQYSPIPNLEVD